MRISNELQIGKAGEYLVCADLIMKGFIAFPSEQGLPYDVLLDNGDRLLRIQVKTCEKPRSLIQRSAETFVYQYNIKRHGKNNQSIYDHDEVDVFALVALDIRTVGYLRNSELKTTMNFRVDALRGTYYDEKGIQTYNKAKALQSANPSRTQVSIAKEMGIHVSMVNRLLSPNYTPFTSAARYFSDIYRNAEWFKAL